ncbi:hypothetical protein CRG98_033619 [Punica granatum]|uniref:Uncharacterized protein n=1 Tax=Punica granatum TaxID=22663 RepID=A0A2I0IPR5_PUNGR|nr:hypothetical protein CRG98_033619 [Punica granatum]
MKRLRLEEQRVLSKRLIRKEAGRSTAVVGSLLRRRVGSAGSMGDEGKRTRACFSLAFPTASLLSVSWKKWDPPHKYFAG